MSDDDKKVTRLVTDAERQAQAKARVLSLYKRDVCFGIPEYLGVIATGQEPTGRQKSACLTAVAHWIMAEQIRREDAAREAIARGEKVDLVAQGLAEPAEGGTEGSA